MYTKEQIDFLRKERENGRKWIEIADLFNRTFKKGKSPSTLRETLKYHDVKDEFGFEELDVSVLRQNRNIRKAAARSTRQLEMVLDELDIVENFVEDVLSGFEDIADGLNEAAKIQTPPISKIDGLKPLTVEVLLSDLHFGKKTEKFNAETARDRIRQLKVSLMKELHVHKGDHNVDKIVIAMLGDIIESSTMHGAESLIGCEFGNSKQVVTAIDILSTELLIPLAMQGYKLEVVGIAGNHDRVAKEKTYMNRGEEFLSYIIYNGLKSITDALKLDITYNIPKETFTVVDFYGSKCLYEHGDEISGNQTRQSFEAHMNKRGKQTGVMLDFIRLGHWHAVSMFEQGRIIINGSLCGSDGYSETLGFDSYPVQVINFYSPSDYRPTSFYKCFPIFLK